MLRRSLLAASLATPALAPVALAQASWRPTRPITLVVPFAAGSGTDAVARIVAEMLGRDYTDVAEPLSYADGRALAIDGGIYEGGPCLVARLA